MLRFYSLKLRIDRFENNYLIRDLKLENFSIIK